MTQSKVLIYGATGYTGELIARQAVQEGVQPVLGGRTAAKLEPVAAKLNTEFRTFALEETAQGESALADVVVLLNCAGPFARTAGPLVDICLDTGTHYLDLAGEVPEFEALTPRSDQAKAAGVMLMPGVGFGVVPTDCLAAHLEKALPSAHHLTLAFAAIGGISQGTAQTLIRDLTRPGVIRQNGALVPARPAQKRRRIDFGQGETVVVSNPWRGDLSTAYHTTGIPNIETYTAFPGPVAALMAAGPAIGWLWNARPVQRLLAGLANRLPPGPDDEALAKGSTHVWGEATDQAGQSVTARLHGPEAYRFTAFTALAVVRRVLAGEVEPGFQTPAGLYGPEFVLELPGVRLNEKLPPL